MKRTHLAGWLLLLGWIGVRAAPAAETRATATPVAPGPATVAPATAVPPSTEVPSTAVPATAAPGTGAPVAAVPMTVIPVAASSGTHSETVHAGAQAADTTRVVIFDFTRRGQSWPSVKDAGRGGRSIGAMTYGEKVAVFSGTVSLKNGEGSASVRSPVGYRDLSEFEGIFLRIRGDGKIYGFQLRNARDPEGFAYQANFETRPGQWEDLYFTFEDFRPVRRGRSAPDSPSLTISRIQTFGLIIERAQDGPFRLEAEKIGAYRVERSRAAEDEEGKAGEPDAR
jgi:NADH dehydrogenase [ubiquinone] 1 alpha subcomplex assembly factor 1